MKIVRVAVTGAAGQIGYALLFRIAAGEMFGPNVQVELSLLELESAVRSLTGVVMELEDGAFPLLKKINITTNPAVAFADADWALLIGSIPRKAGMERRDLLHVNARIFVQQGMALSETAKTTCKVLVVGNPCNTNAFITKEYAKRLDPQNIFAMTMLDHNRAVTQLAKRAGVGIRDISCMTIWGNHSSTQFPDFLHAKINNKLASEVILDDVWLKGEYLDIVQKRGTAIIGARGCSSAASAAQAILDSVKAVHSHTAQGDWFSMATVSDGSYGVPEGLVFGFPVCSDGNKCTIIKNLHHTEFAQNKIKLTLQELVEEKEQINTFL